MAIGQMDEAIAKPQHRISAADVAPEHHAMIAPHRCFMIKGWSRGLAALTLMACAYEQSELLQVRS